jgi:ketosteroid isomerase-like protein
MSQENVEVVRATFEAVQDRGLNSVFAFLAPGIEWKARPDLPDAGIYKGHDGVHKLLSRFTDVMENMWFRPEDFIPVSEAEVVVPLRWGGRGKGSRLDFEERRETWVFSVRDGKIVRVKEFATREQALEAAGLSE